MRFSLHLLGRYVDLAGVDPVWLVEQVTRSVAEVDARTTHGDGLQDIRMARIVSVAPHPVAPTLTVCQVDAGAGLLTVVCGAPNARPGLVTAFAPPGTVVSGRPIVERPVQGVHSAGMPCSPKELELTDGPTSSASCRMMRSPGSRCPPSSPSTTPSSRWTTSR